jgi:hypothetical protein
VRHFDAIAKRHVSVWNGDLFMFWGCTMRFVLLAASVALAACQPAAAPTAPDIQSGEAVHEDAPVFDGARQPISKTAESITGALQFDVGAIRFGVGHVYETAPLKLVTGLEAEAATTTFAISDKSAMKYELRRVTRELVNAAAPNGGLCQPAATTFILLGAKYDPNAGSSDVYLAAYTGQDEPGPAAKDSKLCGTFTYGRGQ